VFDTVNVIGSGRVGSAVSARLRERGVGVVENAELVLLCVPDGAIAELARELEGLGVPVRLLAAVPEADPHITRTKPRLRLRSQDPPSLLHLPSGCAFHPRCPWAESGLCDVIRPELTHVRAQEVACHVAVREGALPDLAATT